MQKPLLNAQVPVYDSASYNNILVSLERYMCLQNFTYHCLNDTDKQMIASMHRGSLSTALQYALVILAFYVLSLFIVLISHLNEIHGKWNWSLGDVGDLFFGGRQSGRSGGPSQHLSHASTKSAPCSLKAKNKVPSKSVTTL